MANNVGLVEVQGTSSGAPAVPQREHTQGRPSDVVFRIGHTAENQDEYMALPIERVIAGDLTSEQALNLFQSAEFGVHDLEIVLGNAESGSVEALATEGVLKATAGVYRSVAETIHKLTSKDPLEQRHLIQDVFKTFKRRGLLDTDMLLKAVEAENIRVQNDEKQRLESIDRNDRLLKLGFLSGFNGTITSYESLEEFIEFPYINHSLPQEQRWPDVVKRAEQAGFIFDQQGRVSGFKTKDGKEVMISEKDRRRQIMVR